MVHKVCPVVARRSGGAVEILAFRHPTAGKQFVKGSLEPGETPGSAAVRELEEESGIVAAGAPLPLDEARIGTDKWHFFGVKTGPLPDRWDHRTADDHGHVFSFFWHPLDQDLDKDWHSRFHKALGVIRRSLPR